MILVFVYGTLMRGGCRHSVLSNEEFVAELETLPQYRLYDCGSYPGLVRADDGVSIEGEVWRVSQACLRQLDSIEGVDDGLYERRPVALATMPANETVEAYFYLKDVSILKDAGTHWENHRSIDDC